MKKLLTLALMLASMLAAQAQNDPYRAEMDGYLEQERTIYNEYKTLYQQQARQETAEGQARMEQLEAQLETLEQKQVELTVRIARENHDNQLPASYIKTAAYSLSFEQLTAVLDSTAAYYNNKELDNVKRIYAGMKKRQPGQHFHELSMKDMAGKDVTLSQWAG